ncbi:unnamed protein product [Leptosia nina]|uniref:Uncharacterized protein n=1 Tax=Leptosia nina TaxID=320188 RepID=A0AAV1IV86_9NEOP
MEESKIALFQKAAALLKDSNNKTHDILKSHYLLQCPRLTLAENRNRLRKGRCYHCRLEWTRDTKNRIKPIKLSKRQKRRKKSKVKNSLLNSKQLERICSFCGNVTVIQIPKLNINKHIIDSKCNDDNTTSSQSDKKQIPIENKICKTKAQKPINVYSNASEIFSLRNDNNTLKKDTPQKINNNKKKKDKFAGLCQKAVLDAAKRKLANEKKNKINFFFFLILIYF